MLDIVLKDILRVVTPSQEDWAIRFAIVNDLQSIVESVESLRGEFSEDSLFIYMLCVTAVTLQQGNTYVAGIASSHILFEASSYLQL